LTNPCFGFVRRGIACLFSPKMMRMVDILSDYCRMRGFPFQLLDRLMPNALRVRAVYHYIAPESSDYVFLISTRVGGLGINLATADTVSYFDSDWNPQDSFQAESRANCVGQTRTLKYFDCLAEKLSKNISLNGRSEMRSRKSCFLWRGMG
jgi:chromodomain-helicase-DNA-binding protein 1